MARNSKRILKLLIDADLKQSEIARALERDQSLVCRVIHGEKGSPYVRRGIERLLTERLGRPVKIAWPRAA
ncbi:hypothetical protein LCGC14_1465540 [marine sediment metagenome]|uniref:Uncharacterized protein n=1 Tax=marine sediment metagenome TaxID=412755 RepID=A0A0F9JDV8_9ZZZZ